MKVIFVLVNIFFLIMYFLATVLPLFSHYEIVSIPELSVLVGASLQSRNYVLYFKNIIKKYLKK